MMKAKERTATADREIRATRIFDAPRELVYEMWTDPERIAKWWGPRGFTTTIHEMAVRPGGVWRHTMHGPDGTDYPNETRYIEVVEPSKLVYDLGVPDAPPICRTTVEFFEQGEQTRLEMCMLFPSKEDRDAVAEKHGAVEGLMQTLDCLTEEIAGGDDSSAFVITRVFDAPRELVWKAWTEAERLTRWFGPAGFKLEAKKFDFRPDGIFHYKMTAPDGNEMFGRFLFREIAEPEHLVWVNSFADAAGNATRPPFEDRWPVEMLTVLRVLPQGERTSVTIVSTPLNADAAERQTFARGHADMTMGWTGTLDQLGEHLAGKR